LFVISRLSWLAGVVAVAAVALFTADAPAQKTAVKPSKEWAGSVEDEALAKDAPACITSARGLEKLWKAWKIADKAPEVDFTREIVVLTTTRGSKLKFFAALDEKGNLMVGGLGTQDLRPGFRYVIATVSKEGVKTVNGKELPKE
jgi:hypothetical protein